MTDSDLFQAIRSGRPQIVAIDTIIWWSRKIDLCSKDQSERLDRHEARIRQIESSHHTHAMELAKIGTTLISVKATLDRMYEDLWDRDR